MAVNQSNFAAIEQRFLLGGKAKAGERKDQNLSEKWGGLGVINRLSTGRRAGEGRHQHGEQPLLIPLPGP